MNHISMQQNFGARRLSYFVAAAVLQLIASAAFAETTAFVGATIMPVSDDPIEDGVLIVEDGKIRALGTPGSVRIPRDAVLIDVANSVIIPGLVDTHSHIGEPAGADRSSPIQPEARVLDSINVRDAGFKRALAGGITTVNLMSGSGHLMSGQTIYVKLREGNAIETIAYKKENGSVDGGMKMANGSNPRRDPPFPGTRAKAASLVRQKYVAAQEYMKKIEAADGDEEKMPDRDLAMEALVEVLKGERIVHHHTHRHDDILTVLRLQKEFGYRVVLHHVSEAHRVADEIAAADVPVSLIMIDSPGGKLEAMYIDFKNAPALEQAGARVAFHTDDYISDSRLFMRMAALGVRAGMTRETALNALTLEPAKMLDLDDRIGSLERGKDADFVVLSGDPFSVYTRVQQTWVEGVKRFDIDDADDRAVAEGGFGALQPSVVHEFHGYEEGH
ncbi:MAG: imidazolonepropionase-like amidohydrolase [Woeseiaceae bacterium]|jgi:imidazolonepropionase-like amidohydrolase